ncbi:Apea-like HEPN domain-containing protein [Halomonas sp. NYA30]
MDFKKERVHCHNKYPEVIQFKAESKFEKKLNKVNGVAPFYPVQLGYGDDPIYQTCIGHLIDGLELLPYRPDFMFDHCFKIIDEAGSFFFSRKGVKGIVQGVPQRLLNQSREDWESIIDLLGVNIPLMTCRFLVKRICEAHFLTDGNSKQLTDRASHCFGALFYNEFIKRFAVDDSGQAGGSISTERINKGASFLKLYLSGKKGTQRARNSSYKCLDLANECNVPTPNQRMELLLSLLLFNMRNERSHGAVLSPFRTSKSSIGRYESYYFAMICSYIFCLGVLDLRGFGSLSGEKIKTCAEKMFVDNKYFLVSAFNR